MRITLYTEKTVSQSLSAINERIQAKGTSSRTALDGWIEKGGSFSIAMKSPVLGKFSRTTRLSGKIERQSGITVVKCEVPNGAAPRGRLLVFLAMGAAALLFIASGNALIGIVIAALIPVTYVPLAGDYHNSAVLITEVQRALKAKTTLPKPAKSSAAGGSAGSRAGAKPASSRTTPTLTSKDLFE